MKILIDMNLPPGWVDFFEKRGMEAVHWSQVGDPWAEDEVLLQWAHTNRFLVFTHDLDFGSILASNNRQFPSIFQVRTQDVTPDSLGLKAISALKQLRTYLETGALVTLDESRSRVRILPIHPDQ